MWRGFTSDPVVSPCQNTADLREKDSFVGKKCKKALALQAL